MTTYTVHEGQSIFDVAVQIYGDITKVYDLIDDNAFPNGLDTEIVGGEVISIRDGNAFTANTITEYFKRFPATIVNWDYAQSSATFTLILKEIRNEDEGNDGYIIIEPIGTPDYSFQWTNQDTGTIVSTSQNLVASPAGTYSVIAVDADGNEAALTNLVISVVDNTVYLVDDFGNYVTDDNGNLIIVN